MKAIDLIKTLFDGWLNLEQGGVFVMVPETDEQFIIRFFDMDRVVRGKFKVGEYVYFYAPEMSNLEHYNEPADVVIEDNNGAIIGLWRVE